MAPLGWSGGSQFSSMVLSVGSPIMVSMRGGEGAVGTVVGIGVITVRWTTDENEYMSTGVRSDRHNR